jgi:hypothetical protein
VVSWALYTAYNRDRVWSRGWNTAAVLRLLRKKEADPRSGSLLEIIQLLNALHSRELDPVRVVSLRRGVEFTAQHPEYFRYAYEDLVAGWFGPLAEYLGLPLTPDAPVVPEEHKRVERSRAVGSWRDWFTPEDVDYYRPLLAPILAAYGYADEWELNPAPVLDPRTGSRYVERIVLAVQHHRGIGPWRRAAWRVERALADAWSRFRRS